MNDHVLRTNGYICKNDAYRSIDLEASFLHTHSCSQDNTFVCQFFIQIVNVLDLRFQDQRFESSTFGSSNVIYLTKRRQVGQTQLLPTHIKSHVAFRLAYIHLTLAHSKGYDHMSTVNISQTVTDRANIVTANKYKVHNAFPLAYLCLTSTRYRFVAGARRWRPSLTRWRSSLAPVADECRSSEWPA